MSHFMLLLLLNSIFLCAIYNEESLEGTVEDLKLFGQMCM